MVTRVVHINDPEGYDVYIGRPSKWGNPFRLKKEQHRADVIARYEAYIQTRPDLLAALGELRGKRLACYCAPKACHGDVLARLADAEMARRERLDAGLTELARLSQAMGELD